MDDLISREALIEYLISKGFLPAIVRNAIETAPAVDAVEITRCKDCKHTKTDESEEPAIYCKKCDRWEMSEDFFCGYGEREEK